MIAGDIVFLSLLPMQKQLETAKSFYGSLRLLSAYHIFRRYFDRMPFQPEKEHDEYIGMFVRILLELGKKNELEFYLKEIEKHYARTKDPALGYALAVVYRSSDSPQLETARSILESLLGRPDASEFHNRVRMVLAAYYEKKGEIEIARGYLESVTPEEDSSFERLKLIFRALLFKHDSKYDEGLLILKEVIDSTGPDDDWYGYFTARIVEGYIFFDLGKLSKARAVLRELDVFTKKHTLKSLQEQAKELRQLLAEVDTLTTLRFYQEKNAHHLVLKDKTVILSSSQPWEKLLVLLLKRKKASKEHIIKSLYKREYNPGADDAAVYYQMFALRKQLKKFGLSSKTLLLEKGSYRLNARIEWERSEQ